MKYSDLNQLSRDELLEEYSQLLEKCNELRSSKENDDQRIYDLKRALDTAEAAQSYLSQELEQVLKGKGGLLDEQLLEQKNKTDEWCKKTHSLEKEMEILQTELDDAQHENVQLRQQLETALTKNLSSDDLAKEQLSTEQHMHRIQELEEENRSLLQKLEQCCEINTQKTLVIAEHEKNLEIFRDEIKCLKENLRCKREELDEKSQLFESTQEQLVEANSMIASLSRAPDQNNDRKGNSLFAEVDDQRQVMKQVLMVQKKNYMEMKKIYTESEYEIRRLKRENKSFHTELEACISIFCNADKTYCNKLNDQICRLVKEIDSLEKKLAWTQERLKTIAQEKDVNWVNSMLDFCNKETTNYKQQLHSVRIQNASLEQGQRKIQQEMVRWRFESLKSRVILANYEEVLKDNKIPFKPIHSYEFRISEEEQIAASPRIISHKSLADMLVTKPAPNSSKSQMNGAPLQSPAQNKSEGITTPEEPKEIVKTPDVNINVAVAETSADIEIDKENLEKKDESEGNLLLNEESFAMTDRFSKLKVKMCSPMKPSQRTQISKKVQNDNGATSILKQQDPFAQQSLKKVSFSAAESTVHKIESDLKTDSTTREKSPKTDTIVIKDPSSQSNIVVKRMVIQKSRQK